MKLASERDFKVRYFEKEGSDTIWIVESHMMEEEHDIKLILEIDMEQMVILDASIKFNRFPQAECKLVEDIASKIVGLRIDRAFSQNALRLVMGPEGCPNIMTLLNISVPGIIYYYYPYKIKQGQLTQAEFFDLLRENEKTSCLAHTKMFLDHC